MKTATSNAAKGPSTPMSWFITTRMGVMSAIRWLASKVVGPRKPLSRAEEKERRQEVIERHSKNN